MKLQLDAVKFAIHSNQMIEVFCRESKINVECEEDC